MKTKSIELKVKKGSVVEEDKKRVEEILSKGTAESMYAIEELDNKGGRVGQVVSNLIKEQVGRYLFGLESDIAKIKFFYAA